MKHTPGPWTVEKDSVDPQTLNIHSGSVPFVASVWGDGGTFFEQAANARLIAAAPDLLAALKRYHSIICANAIELDCDAAIELAKTVIAKAGE